MDSNSFSCSATRIFLVLAVALLTPNGGIAQKCLQPAANNRDIPFQDLGMGGNVPRLASGKSMGVQAIITSYQFHCCGNVTAWQTYVEPGGGGHNGKYDITFQVWRPSPTVNSDRCYSLVGENEFTRISSPNYNSGLISVTPEPTNRITAQPGDVVGFYAVSRKGGNDGIQISTSFTGECVWYHRNTSNDPLPSRGMSVCPFPVGSQSNRELRSSTNAAPMLSVDISTSSCPMSPTPRPSPAPIASSSSLSVPIPTIAIPDSPTPHSSLVLPITPPPIASSSSSLPAPTPTLTILDSSISPITDRSIIVAVPITTTTTTPASTTTESLPTITIAASTITGSPPTIAASTTTGSPPNTAASTTASSPIPTTGTPVATTPSSETQATIPSTEIEDLTTEETSTEEVTTERSIAKGNNTGAAVGAAVGVLVLVVLVLVIVIAVIVVFRRRSSWKLSNDGSLAFGNAMYSESSPGKQYASVNYDYTGVSPRVYNGPNEAHGNYEQSHEYSYAHTGAGAIDNVVYDAVREKVPELPPSNSKKQENSQNEESIYMVPGSNETTLYSQLEEIKTDNVTRETIILGDFLGSGQFGTVYKGVWWSATRGEVNVAVKTLKEGSGGNDRIKFLQEAAIMGQFKNPNVVTMYGVVTNGEPILLVLEVLTKGDLRGHLLKMRPDEGKAIGVDDHTLLSYCRQVASGMAYLSNKAFVHRDLAARNILVSEDEICKIADFGMSRDLMDENYYVSHGGKIPVKWTAPEALHYKKYSSASDVWSYGALMYEIWSVGHKPFETFTNTEVLKLIDAGFRLPPPPGCPRALYSIMISCWHSTAFQRPKFTGITKQLSLLDVKILQWSEEDRSVHPEAAKLGADLQCGQQLYRDLQATYKEGDMSDCEYAVP